MSHRQRTKRNDVLTVYTNHGAVMKQMSVLKIVTGKTGELTKLQFYS